MRAPKNLTLDQWVDSLHADIDAPWCPRCGAKGDLWPVEETALLFDFACGSFAEVPLGESEYLKSAYRQLVASCPVFVPPGPRRRLWDHAQ